MAEFSWAYIDSAAIVSASGPTGSIQYRVADAGGNTAVSGTQNFIYHTASNLLAITGSVEISGTLTANQYNVNVIDKTVTNISASGDTIFGDTADDTHQFTGSVYVNGPLSASTNISASAFYGDGSTLTGVSPAGSNTEVQFNNAGAFGASALARILVVGGAAAALAITGSVIVTGSALNTTTVIDGTHVSSSLNISGSSIYAEDDVHADQFYGDITVPRYVTHDGDSDTHLDFTDDKLTVKVGNREFLTITEAGTDTFVINRLEGAVNTTINTDNGDVLNASTAGIIINDSGMPGHDFRVESNQKQNAIYLDADLQYVHLLADDATPTGGVGTDMALFVSGTIGSKNTAVRGTAVFGGDMVVSGSLYGIDTIFGDTADDTHQFTGSVYVNGPLSASTNISASAFYGDGSALTGISATSISGAMGQFNTTSGLLITSGNAYLGDGASDITTIASQLTASQGALFNEQVMIVDDKNLVFGNQGDSIIKYDEAGSNALVISGSSTGLWLGGGSVIIDSPLIQITGSTIISGTLTTTDDINLLDDKKLNLGDSADALIEYDSGIGRLAISGSATGIELMGGSIGMDYPGGTVVSGTAAGAGSFLALNSSHQVVVATPAGGGGSPGGSANQIQINDGLGSFAGTTALTWNSPRLAVTGTLDVSGSIEKLGYIQLGRGTAQNLLIDVSNPQVRPSTGAPDVTSLSSLTPTTTPIFVVEWDDTVRLDDSHYSSSATGIVVTETGDYKLSYSLNYAQDKPNNARSNMKSFATVNFSGSIPTTGSAVIVPFSHAYCYLRGDGGTNWGGDSGGNATTRFGTGQCTTIMSASEGDTINLACQFFGGATSGDFDVKLLANQSWITIEKI